MCGIPGEEVEEYKRQQLGSPESITASLSSCKLGFFSGLILWIDWFLIT